MTYDRLLILIVLLASAGIAFAVQAASQTSEHLHGYAVFGGCDADQDPSISYVSFNTDAGESVEHSLAAPPTRAYFIVAGRDIYFDANENGLPESSEQFKTEGNSFEVTSSDGRSKYRLTSAFLGLSPEAVSESTPQYAILSVDVMAPDQAETVLFRQSGRFSVFPEPVDEGWAHFDGPLLMEFVDPGLKLPASEGPTVELRLAISTTPVECSAEGNEKVGRGNRSTVIPDLIVPAVTIDFPSSSGGTITKRYDLDQFC